MQVAFLLGRVIVGVYYLMSRVNHFTKLGMMSSYAAAKGIPAPKVAVIVSGFLLLVAALTLLTGYRPTIGVIALVVFFVPVTFTMHAFWAVQEPMSRMSEMINFTKNLALLGSSLMFLAIRQPWPFSLH